MEKDTKEDDEISIDFSKITRLFKGKKKEENAESSSEKKEEPVAASQGKSEEEKKEPSESETKEEAAIEKTESQSAESEKIEVKTETQEETKEKESEAKKETKDESKPAEKDDDEINIDFGKIKNMFKSDEAAGSSETSAEHRSQSAKGLKDDEINIDFSKLKNVKNIFKKSEKTSSKEEKSEDEISIDFSQIKNFVVKHRVFLLLLIPIILSIFLRVQSAYLPITDEWAVNSVSNGIKNQIRDQINQQYPNLPGQNKDVLVDNEFAKLLSEQRAQIDQQVAATSNAFKQRMQDDSGQTYLLAIDPYFWMRHARNIIEHGHPGDEIRDGVYWDNHMLAPQGRPVPGDMFHAYVIAYLFKFLNFFGDFDLMKVTFFVPVLISALAVIPAFFITRRVTGDVGALFASVIVALHPAFLSRTAGGFADSDAYNVLFPLLIAWFFVEALEAKSMKKLISMSALGGVLVGLFSFTWAGWWYIFDFILASTGFFVFYYIIVHRSELKQGLNHFLKTKAIKNSIIFAGVFFVASAIIIIPILGFSGFFVFFDGPFGFAKLKEVGIRNIWPNVYTTVAEQNPASLSNVINQIGLGKPAIFLIALVGIVMTLSSSNQKRRMYFLGATIAWYAIVFFMDIQNLNTFLLLISIPIVVRILMALWLSEQDIDIKYAIFLIMWFVATTYASTKGIRFTLLLVPAFGIGFGIFMGEVYKYVSDAISRMLSVNKTIARLSVVTLLIVLFLIPPFTSAQGTARNEIPSFGDAWRTSLEAIKADSEPDAIISSWWDFGHWFKYWADRPVTFDGTSQNTAPAHWIGKVLLTDNEKQAVGILRMLHCGNRDGYRRIVPHVQDGEQAVQIMYDMFEKDREGAAQVLRDYGIEEEHIDGILEKTHCDPPENYFITSEDMVGKSGVWSHFGSWDFERALIYNTFKKDEYEDDLERSVQFLQERFDYDRKTSEDLFFEVQGVVTNDQANTWIAPWPGYAGVNGCGSPDENNVLSCGNGFTINLTTYHAEAATQSGIVHPKAISFMEDDGYVLKHYNESLFAINNGRHLGLALIKRGNSYEIVQMDSALAGAMFTRMFYQEGRGLKYFEKFSDEQSVFGSRIIVWKVDWEGTQENIITPPAPEPTPEPESEVEEVPEENEADSVENESVEEIPQNESEVNDSDTNSSE